MKMLKSEVKKYWWSKSPNEFLSHYTDKKQFAIVFFYSIAHFTTHLFSSCDPTSKHTNFDINK